MISLRLLLPAEANNCSHLNYCCCHNNYFSVYCFPAFFDRQELVIKIHFYCLTESELQWQTSTSSATYFNSILRHSWTKQDVYLSSISCACPGSLSCRTYPEYIHRVASRRYPSARTISTGSFQCEGAVMLLRAPHPLLKGEVKTP